MTRLTHITSQHSGHRRCIDPETGEDALLVDLPFILEDGDRNGPLVSQGLLRVYIREADLVGHTLNQPERIQELAEESGNATLRALNAALDIVLGAQGAS